MADDSHAIFIVHRTQPGQRDAVKAVWMKHMAPAIADNDGHLAYHYCYDQADPDLLRVFQLYRNAEAAAAFLSHPNYAAYQQEVRDLLIEPSEIHAADPQWQKT